MNSPESDDIQELIQGIAEKRQRNGSPESDENEEMGLGFAEKRQRTVSPVSDDDPITVFKDFLAECNQVQENPVMEVMMGLQEEISFPNDINNNIIITSVSSAAPFSTSSFVTINGNTESCGSSFSDPNSSLMASIDFGLQNIIAYLMWDGDVLKDLAVKIGSALDCLILKTEQNGRCGSSSSDLERWFLSLKKGITGTDENGLVSSFDFNQWVLGFNGGAFETEQNFEEEEEEDSGDLDRGCLSLSDSSIKTEQNGEEESSESSDSTIKTGQNGEEESSSGCLSLSESSESSFKSEQNGQEEEEEETEESSGCLSLSEPITKTEDEESSYQKEITNGFGGKVELETVDEWIERVVKEMPIPFEFEFEMEV